MAEALASLGYLRPELYAQWANWLQMRGVEYEDPEAEEVMTARLARRMLQELVA